MGFGTGKRDGLDPVSFLSSCRNRNRNRGHRSTFGNHLTHIKHQHSRSDRSRRTRNRTIPSLNSRHQTDRLPKCRSSPARIDHCSSIPSHLQAGSLWLLSTNEDERHDDGEGALLEGFDEFECMAPSRSGGVTVEFTLYIRSSVDVWAVRRLRRNRAIIEW